MKKTLIALAFLPAVAHGAPAGDYVNFIRQIQQDTGVEWDIAVPAEGKALSPTGVSADGSFFELWSIHGLSAVEYLLDEQFVTSYTPNAEIAIVTGDPYGPIRRTRVDQPFKVLITVAGLIEGGDPTIPEASRKVDYTHATFSYEAGTHSIEETVGATGKLLEEGFMEVNGTATVRFASTNLTGPDLTAVEGEEIFTVSAKADFGVSASVLDSKKVQIWPVARAALSGYDPTVRYEAVPAITLSLVDLYPDSKTYIRIYEGPSQSNVTAALEIPESVVVISDSIPQDRTLTLSGLDVHFNEEGLHTIEVLHETPFGIDLLASGSILVDRTIEIVGGFYASE